MRQTRRHRGIRRLAGVVAEKGRRAGCSQKFEFSHVCVGGGGNTVI